MTRETKRIFVKRVGRYFKINIDEQEQTLYWDDFFDFLKNFRILGINKTKDWYEVEVCW